MRYYLTLWLFVLLVNTEVLASLRSPQHGSDPHHAEGSDPLRDPVLSRGGGSNATLHYGTPHGHRALFKGGSSSSLSSSLSSSSSSSPSSSSSSLSASVSASSASGASSLAGTQARREAPVAASNSTHSRMRRRRGRRKVMMMMVVGTPAERSKVGYGSEPGGNSSLRGSATPRHGRRKWPPVGGRRHNTASPPPPVPRRRWWGGGVGGRQQESDRRKRGTKDEHQQQHQHQHQKKKKKASERGRKRPNENERPAALRASPWEQMPKPAALSSSTDEPPSTSTRREDNPWDATPMTPPSPQDPSPHDLLPRNPFYPVTGETYGAYAIACVSAVIFLAGVAGNIAILCIVCQNYYMKSISNSLLANLAAWDFVLVFFCLPMVVFHQLTQSWLLGDFTCKVVPYLEVASLGVTTFTLCALCIDRFRAATNVQMYYEMIENCTSTTAKLAVIWIGALLLALPELLIRQLVVEEASAPDEPPSERCVVRISTELPDTLYVLGLTYEGARLWWCFGCYFCLPTLFTIGCSLVTARKIRRAERASSVRGNKKQIRLESQMNCTVVALAIVYGACVVPENICNIAAAYMAAGVPERAMAALHFLSQLLLFCRAAVTPALLLLLCRPLGRAFLDCCCCCCCAAHAPPSSAAGSDDNEHECTTELELSPFSTIRRELSNYTPPATAAAAGTGGTNC